MTMEETLDLARNILLAKKYMVESIYRSANIEGIGVTFPETQTICDGMSIAGHTIDEINAVTDLKKAWQWFFLNPTSEINAQTLLTVNRIIGKYTVISAGCIRTSYDEPIRVPLYSGKDYYPPVPESEDVIDKGIKGIISEYKALDAAMELFCYICKGQFFNDGNKRTATLFVNMYMIQNGLGLLSIPPIKKLEFYTALTNYYDNDECKNALIKFLKDFCITPELQNTKQ